MFNYCNIRELLLTRDLGVSFLPLKSAAHYSAHIVPELTRTEHETSIGFIHCRFAVHLEAWHFNLLTPEFGV
jgi:hypothetical protein